jgi:hypothetical protein
LARLPVPGSDEGHWGDILNEYLSVSLGTDGTLKDNTVSDDQITSVSQQKVTGLTATMSGKADNAAVVHKTGNEVVDGIKTFSISPIVPAPSDGTDAANKSYVDAANSAQQTALGLKVDKTTAINTSTGLTGGGDLGASRTLSVVNDSTTQKVRISKAGTLTGTRQELNLIEGTNVTITEADDVANNRVNVTIAAQSSVITVEGGWFYAAEVATGTGTFRLYNDSGVTRTISKVRATVGTAPTGSALTVDVNKGGTTIFTTQANRPSIAAASNTITAIPDITTWENGTYLTADADAVGSATPGSDLVISVVWS